MLQIEELRQEIETLKSELLNAKNENKRLSDIINYSSEIKKTQDALNLEKDKLEAVINNITTGVVVSDLLGNFFTMNRAAFNIHGLNNEGAHLNFDFFTEDFELEYLDGCTIPLENWPFSQALRGNYVKNFEVKLKNLINKSCRYVSYNVEPIYDAEGKLILIVFNLNDFTEHHLLQRSLIDSEIRYNFLFNNKTSGVAHCRAIQNAEGRTIDFEIIQVNEKYTEISGLRKDEIEGKTAINLLPEIEPYIEMYGKVAFEGQEFSFEAPYRTRVKWLSVYAYSPKKGEFTVIFNDITERKHIEEKLKLNEATLEAFFNSSPGILNLFDSDLQILKTDNQTPAYFGLDAHEFIGKSLSEIDPEIGAIVEPLFGNINATNKSIVNLPVELQFKGNNRDKSYFSLSMFPVPLPQNKLGYGCIGIDITEQKTAENSLATERELFEGVFNSIPVMITIYDPAFKSFRFNKALEHILGWSEEDALDGKFVEKVYPDPELRSEVANFMATLEKGWREFSATTKKGERKETSWANILLSDGIQIGIGIDISERKEAERKIKENEDRFLTLADNIDPFAWMADRRGDIFWFNKRWFDYTGTTIDEVKGQNWFKVHHPDHVNRVKQGYFDALLKGIKWEDSFPLRSHDGSYGWFLSRALPVYSNNGEVIYWFGTNTNITKLRQTEEDLVKAKEKAEESDRLKSSFMANMSHEIRTPMTGILGFTDLLKSSDISEKQKNTYLEIIETSGHQMLQIINDLIDISKIEAGQMNINPEETNVSKLLKELLLFFIPETNKKSIFLKLTDNIPSDYTTTTTDKVKLTQVLSNLIKNALKFTNEGSIEFGCDFRNNTYCFFVKDTGVGIKKEYQNKIFERFSQVENNKVGKVEGVGLGLAISKAFVEILGGKITVDSEPFMGSVFSFTIPYKPAAETLPLLPQNDVHTKGIKINSKILIAEDEEAIYFLIKEILRKNNIETVHACNGQQAIDLIKTENDVKLILMDTKMPLLNGLDATKIIKAIKPNLPVIALSAFCSEADKHNAFKAGCSDYLNKPLNKTELLDKILLHLNKSN